MNYIVKNMRMHVDGLDAHISDLDLLCESILEGNPDLFDPDEIGNALIGIRTLLFIRKEIFADLVLSLENMDLDDRQILNKIIPIAEDEEEFYENYEADRYVQG
jgi:hypothetical protein